MPPLRTSSASLRSAPVPIPSGLRPSPLDKGSRPLKGKAYGRVKTPAPTAENGPGALARQSQAQSWNRSSGNFCKPRAQWPGGNLDQPLHFCAPEIFCLAQGVTPVMGVQGVGGMEAGAATPFLPIAPTPWRLFGSFLSGQKGTRRRGGEISPCAQRIQSEICPLIRPSVSTGAPSPPRGKAK